MQNYQYDFCEKCEGECFIEKELRQKGGILVTLRICPTCKHEWLKGGHKVTRKAGQSYV